VIKMKRLLLVIAALCMAPSLTLAQDISQYPTVRNPERFTIDWKSVYLKGNAMTAETRQMLPHHLDLPYGDDPKQRLDLYLPKEPVAGAPVLVFFHGGGFAEGDRAHYGYIAAPFARQGIVTAIASYRLTSDGHHYPAQADDTKSAVVWLHRNVARFGGDPDRLFISGHSAGAIMIADVGVDRGWLEALGISRAAIKGIVPVSGSYDIGEGSLDAYAPTMALKRQASAVHHVNDPAPAAVIAFGTREDGYREPSRVLARKLEEKGVAVALLALEGEDHKDTVMSLGTEGSVLFDAVMGMIRGASGALTPEQEAFWDALSVHCGNAYAGSVADATEYYRPNLEGRAAVIHFFECSDERLHIPLHLDDNRSRNWILTRTGGTLRLKHDHRHDDGTEEAISQYGGDAPVPGLPSRQIFWADAHTAALIPERRDNFWFLELTEAGTLEYGVHWPTRGHSVRFAFDLSTPVDAPPAPWGW